MKIEQKAIEILMDDINDLCMGDDEIPSSYPQDRKDAYEMAIEALKKSGEPTYRIIKQDKLGLRVIKTEVIATGLTEEAAKNVVIELNGLDEWGSYLMKNEE